MSPTFETKDFNKEEMAWQQYHLCMAVEEHQILGVKHFLILGSESGMVWCLKKVQHLQKSTTANGLYWN